MKNHLVEQHFTSIVHTHSDHSKAVTNKDDVHAGMIGDMGTWEVMGSDDCDRLLLTVETLNGVDGNRFPCCECCTQGRV